MMQASDRKRWAVTMLVGLILPTHATGQAAKPLAAPAAQATPTPHVPPQEQTVALRTFGFYRPDCTNGGMPTLSVLVPPQHGQLTFKSDVPFQVETSNNGQCLGTMQRGVTVYYTPRGTGPDTMQIQVTYPDGHIEKLPITVTPK